MKKSSKALLAAGAAVVVLTGGAGSLAFWNATADVGGGSIQSGELSLTPVADGTWEFNGASVADPTAVVLVPGDELTYSGSYTVGAVGDNIQASVDVNGDGGAGTLAPFVTTQVAASIAGTEVTTVDGDDDGDVLAVDLRVEFPFGAAPDNASQELVLDLTGVSVVLTQTDATP